MQGQPTLTEPLAAFLAKFVFNGVAPSPTELVVGTGLSAILSNVFYSLCEPGDAVGCACCLFVLRPVQESIPPPARFFSLLFCPICRALP
jgi:histidinol-phosphate/aromatic aminotransferase/cobyric acid decarboxylase-like protein